MSCIEEVLPLVSSISKNLSTEVDVFGLKYRPNTSTSVDQFLHIKREQRG